jgi:hypothetical protein
MGHCLRVTLRETPEQLRFAFFVIFQEAHRHCEGSFLLFKGDQRAFTPAALFFGKKIWIG